MSSNGTAIGRGSNHIAVFLSVQLVSDPVKVRVSVLFVKIFPLIHLNITLSMH